LKIEDLEGVSFYIQVHLIFR